MMRPELATLLEEVERLSLDDKLYFDLESGDELRVAVQYHLRPDGRNWSAWHPQSEAASRQTVSRKHFPLVLKAFAIPETNFINAVAESLLTQAAFADEFVREIGRLFGDEAVRHAIGQTQDFMDALLSVLQTHLPLDPPERLEGGTSFSDPSSPDETPAKMGTEGNQEAKGRARLRIVRT